MQTLCIVVSVCSGQKITETSSIVYKRSGFAFEVRWRKWKMNKVNEKYG